MITTTTLTDIEARAWRGLSRMAVGLASRLHRRLVATAGISLSDYEVLTALLAADEQQMRAFELGGELQWEKSRLSHHIKRMENRGLVQRTVCESDGRGLWVGPTEEGRAAWRKASEAHHDEVRRLLFDQIDASQLEALAGISDSVVAGMGDGEELCDS